MRLNEFLAVEKRRAFEAVLTGSKPVGMRCDEGRLKALFEKGKPTMGTTVLNADQISFEFVFTLDDGQTEVLSIVLDPPERIVYMPVPEWVVENLLKNALENRPRSFASSRNAYRPASRSVDTKSSSRVYARSRSSSAAV